MGVTLDCSFWSVCVPECAILEPHINLAQLSAPGSGLTWPDVAFRTLCPMIDSRVFSGHRTSQAILSTKGGRVQSDVKYTWPNALRRHQTAQTRHLRQARSTSVLLVAALLSSHLIAKAAAIVLAPRAIDTTPTTWLTVRTSRSGCCYVISCSPIEFTP